MKVIGHRGAAGLALENTAESVAKANLYELDMIEIDVRVTKDKRLAVVHDEHLGVMSHKPVRIRAHTLAELKKIKLHNDERIMSLEEALELCGDTPIVIDLRDANTVPLLLPLIAGKRNIHVASLRHEEVRKIHDRRPKLPIYLLERHHLFDIVNMAEFYGADGIGLPWWLMNPITYLRARRRGLEMIIFNVNDAAFVWFLNLLYPHAAFSTDHPERYCKLRADRA